ncbi:hypothetical protein [Shewanella waksmanii]|uniref:hypothetical protein n=1 Tax=Shewanella waksmanii TaxID=213783 RepID=UPI0037366A48
MNIVLDEIRLNIGVEANTLAAMSLPYVATESQLIDESYVGGFSDSFNIDASNIDIEQHISQLIAPLLQQISSEHAEFYLKRPIFWLMPEVTTTQPDVIERWLAQLQMDYPQLFKHAQSQIFPYGRAALPIALANLKGLVSKGITEVALIAVDSSIGDLSRCLAEDLLIHRDSEQGILPSEGAALALISIKPEGLTVEFSQQSLAVETQRYQAVESLFKEAKSHLAERHIAKLYAPGNGEPRLLQDWLGGYIHLAGCIDQNSEIVQTAYYTGELGGVTGLYNLIHIYHSYRRGRTKGAVVQLELSQSLHHGLAIYSWTGNGQHG